MDGHQPRSAERGAGAGPDGEADVGTSKLVEQVLSGQNPRLAQLAAQGVLPLPQEELIGLQLSLAQNEAVSSAVRSTARESLAELSLSVLVEYIRQDASSDHLSFFLEGDTNPALVEAAIQRRGIDPSQLAEAAPRLDERAQEVLLLRQDLITEHPEILQRLAENPQLSSYSRRLIAEYNQHLLTPEFVEEVEATELDLSDDELTPEEIAEVEEAIAEVKETVEAEGEYDERTGLTEGQVRMLKLPIRIKLTKGAGRTLRGILVRDSNPQVALGVLKASAFSESEAEIVSANRYVCSEVLAEISRRREWIGRYQIAHNVVKNPRSPVATSIKLLPRLSVRDLGMLRRDRNIPDAVRQMAIRLHITRSR